VEKCVDRIVRLIVKRRSRALLPAYAGPFLTLDHMSAAGSATGFCGKIPAGSMEGCRNPVISQCRIMRKLEDGNEERDIGRGNLQGLREIKRGEFGRVIHVPDIAQERKKTGLSQSAFCSADWGVSVRTLQDWEQGRRAPLGPPRTLTRY